MLGLACRYLSAAHGLEGTLSDHSLLALRHSGTLSQPSFKRKIPREEKRR